MPTNDLLKVTEEETVFPKGQADRRTTGTVELSV
jgi:hypothetical protein